MLAQAQKNYRELPTHADQEAFVVSIHGTQLRLVAAHFSSSYLASLATSSLAASEIIMVRRSRAFEIKHVPDRIEALKMLVGFFRYVRSDEIEMGVCRALNEALRTAWGLARQAWALSTYHGAFLSFHAELQAMKDPSIPYDRLAVLVQFSYIMLQRVTVEVLNRLINFFTIYSHFKTNSGSY
jgi:hypothetical protein